MSPTSSLIVLAATSEEGVVLHDVLGGLTLVALIAIGLFLRRHQGASDHSDLRHGTTADRKFSRLQVWALYWLLLAAAIGFFFIMPRATRLKAQRTPGANAVNQSAF